jgi:hypothetical protein
MVIISLENFYKYPLLHERLEKYAKKIKQKDNNHFYRFVKTSKICAKKMKRCQPS